MPSTLLPLVQPLYLFISGVTPDRTIALIFMDGTTPIVLAQVTY